MRFIVLNTIAATLGLAGFVSGAENTLTNHIAAMTFLDEFERLAGADFNENLPSRDQYHFDCGRKLLAYIDTHNDDTNVAERVVTLAKAWANMERANEEMKQDDGGRIVHLWFTRTTFAWVIMRKFGFIREGMKYDDAVALLGRPRGHKQAFDKETEVTWVLGGNRRGLALHTQTWIKAKVDAKGIVIELKIRWT